MTPVPPWRPRGMAPPSLPPAPPMALPSLSLGPPTLPPLPNLNPHTAPRMVPRMVTPSLPPGPLTTRPMPLHITGHGGWCACGPPPRRPPAPDRSPPGSPGTPTRRGPTSGRGPSGGPMETRSGASPFPKIKYVGLEPEPDRIVHGEPWIRQQPDPDSV